MLAAPEFYLKTDMGTGINRFMDLSFWRQQCPLNCLTGSGNIRIFEILNFIISNSEKDYGGNNPD
jgi:hypothetical protein